MSLMSRFPTDVRNLLILSGKDLLDTLGLPALREVVSQVMCGENIRSATEVLTRERIGLLNAALLTMYSSLAREGVTMEDITEQAYEDYRARNTSYADKTVLRWILGLTKKQVENVLRSNNDAWQSYVVNLRSSLTELSVRSQSLFGDFPVASSNGESVGLDWEWGLSLFTAIGSQTLGTRGAEKSMYGKFFEKMILGSVLSLLGFEFQTGETATPKSFWLSSRENKRESDATLIWPPKTGIRFDIGFIGSGNSEITLDKVSRFDRIDQIAGQRHKMHTIIIVDKVGKNSRVEELAREIEGVIIQMSSSNWVQKLGEIIAERLDGYKSPLEGMNNKEYKEAIWAGVVMAPLEKIFQIAVSTTDEIVIDTVDGDD